MKAWLILVPVVGVVGAAVAAGRQNLVWEVKKRSHMAAFETHFHGAKEHQHEHAHITHNRRQGPDMAVGEWEHLTSMHMHLHNHPAVSHAHIPHQDAEHEHLGEAHIHDHDHPTFS